jgi:hypothetical protein
MGFYAGSTEPVAAADVAIGDLLVHDQADTGYLKVIDTRNDGTVSLRFETGDTVTFSPGQRLYRVATGTPDGAI